MNWLNFLLVIGGGTALAYVAYTSTSILQAENEQPGIVHDVLDIFGLGFMTRKDGGFFHGLDRGFTNFYKDVGSTIAGIGDNFTSGYASNFLDNPMVIPIGILLGTVVIGIVFFT